MKLGPTNTVPVVSNAARPEKTGTVAGNAPEKAERESRASVPATPATPATPAAPSRGVAVSVSRLASQLVQSRQAAAADVDLKKVESVRSAIEQRSFKVDAEAIADKMLANAEEMLKQKRN